MATPIELAEQTVSATRSTLAVLVLAMEEDPDTVHVRKLLTGALNGLQSAEILMSEAVSAERFYKVRKAHGLT